MYTYVYYYNYIASIHVTISLLNYYYTMTADYFSTFPLLLFLGYGFTVSPIWQIL